MNPQDRYDLVGVGIGPFNLSLAALAEPVPGLRTLLLDENPDFSWHPGMMVPGATLQVPFLADLVTLADPTSRYSYLAWIRETERLYGFYFAESFHVERREYDAYCRWVAESLPSCRFGSRVTAVRHRPATDDFEVCFTDLATGAAQRVAAANVVLGIGTEPVVPAAVRDLTGDGSVCHSAGYLDHAGWIYAARDITVVGSGQSGAEVVLDLLRNWHRPGRRLRWLTRSAAFAPMEYSKLGLEHFTPDYTDYFRRLPAEERGRLLAGQNQLYKAISVETIAEIHDELRRGAFSGASGVTLMPNIELLGGARTAGGITLNCRHTAQGRYFSVATDRLVLATGYAARTPDFLDGFDGFGRHRAPDVDGEYRVRLNTKAGLYVQNVELATHGVGTPDLGLGAHRAATILNSVCAAAGRSKPYKLPKRTAHTTFDTTVAAVADPGITEFEPTNAGYEVAAS